MKYRDPLAGWPQTRRTDSGYAVRLRVLTPTRVTLLINTAQTLFVIWFFILVMLPPAPVTEPLRSSPFWSLLISVIFVGIFLLGLVFLVLRILYLHRIVGRLLFGARRTLIFDAGARTLTSGRRTFSLDLPHTYEMVLHEKAQEEEDAQQEEYRTKRKPQTLKRFWRDSYHILFRYAGQRYDIIDVKGQREAEQALRRLQLVDELTLSGRDPMADKSRGSDGSGEQRKDGNEDDRRRREKQARQEQQRREEERQRREEEDRRRQEEEQRRRQKEQRSNGGAGGRSGARSKLEEALAVFELPEDFDCATLKARYRLLSQKLHPDKQGSSYFMSQLNTAYQVLRKHRGCP